MRIIITFILLTLFSGVLFSQQAKQPEYKPLPEMTIDANAQVEIVYAVAEVQRVIPIVASDTTGVGITKDTKFFIRTETVLDTIAVPRFFFFDKKSGEKIYFKP